MPIVDYTAIADAYEAAEYSDVDAAFAAMSAESVPDTEALAVYNRAQILRELGATAGLAALSAMTAALQADTDLDATAEQILLELIASDDGLDMAHESTQALLAKWKSAAPPEHAPLFDALLGLGQLTKPVWPGLTRGHIATALDKRVREVI